MAFLNLFKNLFVNEDISNYTPVETSENLGTVRVLFVAPSRVGKTFLINCLFERESSRTVPTEGLSYDDFVFLAQDGSYSIDIIELGGDHSMKGLRKSSFLNRDTIVFVFNSNSAESVLEMKEIIKDFQSSDGKKLTATQIFFLYTTLNRDLQKYFTPDDVEELDTIIHNKLNVDNLRVHFVEIQLSSREQCRVLMNRIITESVKRKYNAKIDE